MRAAANGVELEYEVHNEDGPRALLLIAGYSMQLAHWPEEFLSKLADRGFRVVIYDNRDIGLSQKFGEAGLPDLAGIFAGQAKAAYTLEDSAADAVGLLDALGIDRAHVAGMSMGGMIAQIVAGRYPQRTLSLSAIMTSTNAPGLPPPAPQVLQAMVGPPALTADDAVETSVRMWSAIGSPGYDYNSPAERARFRRIAERSHYPEGLLRQMAAITATGDLRRFLGAVKAPTVVIHGEADPLVNIAGGRDVATNIAGARIAPIAGMGHDLAPFVLDKVVAEIDAVAARAAQTA